MPFFYEKRLQPIHMDKLESVLLASEDASGAKKFGGPGWSRTNDVSYVTVLQTASFTNLDTDPCGCGCWIRTSVFGS